MVSKMIIGEPPLMVSPSLAKCIGLNKALFVQQLHYWLCKAQTHHEGKSWVFNKMDKWLEQFPFWSKRTLERIVADLEEAGIVVSKRHWMMGEVRNKFNLHKQVKWYTIDYDRVEEFCSGDPQPANLTDNTSDNLTDNQPDKSADSDTETTDTETTTETNSEGYASPSNPGGKILKAEAGKRKPNPKYKGISAEKIAKELSSSGDMPPDEIVKLYAKKPQRATTYSGFWRRMWTATQGTPVAESSQKELGQLTHLFKKLPDRPYERLRKVMENWVKFKKYAEEQFGAYNMPLRPHIGWCLSQVNAIIAFTEEQDVQLIAKSEPKKLQSIAKGKQKSYDIVKPSKKVGEKEKPMTLEELMALEQELEHEHDDG